jgi:ATP-binding cassette subfamily B protein
VLKDVKNNGTPNRLRFRDRVGALRYVFPFLGLVWRTHRGYTTAIVLLRVARALVPVGTLWTGKLIIDAVLLARTGQSLALSRVWKLVAIEVSIALAGEVFARASLLFESLLSDLFSSHTSVLLMEHAARLDLHYFEDPAFYDQLERARQQTTGRIGLLAQIFGIAQDTLTLISFAAALFVYSPWLLVLLAITVLPGFLGETHFASLQYSLLYRRTPERRQLDYLLQVVTSDKTAKEVQLFGLAGWLIGRYRKLARRFCEENKKLSKRKGVVASSLAVVGIAGYYGAFVLILMRTVAGAISLGSLAFLGASFRRCRDLTQRLLFAASDVYEQSLYLKDLFEFFQLTPSITSPPNARQVPARIREGIVFEDVGFRYLGQERWAVRHINFQIHPGDRLAFVGENGAGKTTLTKLLARLYDPTEGRILLDGHDLREYDMTSVREAISVIFQDFGCYDLRFDENIGVGEIEKVRSYLELFQSRNGGNGSAGANGSLPVTEREAVPPVLAAAAEKSLASEMLPRFPDGYHQMLGRRFEGGVDLSGGEWQKIALARAYMRESQLLILDEPTSALDARAEYLVFEQLSKLVSGRMAVIISHRFSTVRLATRIIVLSDGAIIEEGTHQQLLDRGRFYAELFRLQAVGYR